MAEKKRTRRRRRVADEPTAGSVSPEGAPPPPPEPEPTPATPVRAEARVERGRDRDDPPGRPDREGAPEGRPGRPGGGSEETEDRPGPKAQTRNRPGVPDVPRGSEDDPVPEPPEPEEDPPIEDPEPLPKPPAEPIRTPPRDPRTDLQLGTGDDPLTPQEITAMERAYSPGDFGVPERVVRRAFQQLKDSTRYANRIDALKDEKRQLIIDHRTEIAEQRREQKRLEKETERALKLARDAKTEARDNLKLITTRPGAPNAPAQVHEVRGRGR